MITKTADWNLVLTGLKEIKRSKKITGNIMKIIRELDLKSAEGKNR